LTHDHYRSFTIESPPVNPGEIKQAVYWRVAEMLDYPVDQAVIDSYPQPKSNRANRAQMLEVVSCNKALLDPLVLLCKQAGLRIKVVDIQETCLRNLATLLPEDEQGVAILHLQPAIGHVIIEKQGAVYLSRKFDFNYRFLTESGFNDELDAQTEQSNLALEIQRSFDYVENYFDIPPINSLASVLLPANTQGVINALMLNHGITARAMDITAIVDVDIMLSDSLQNICAPVIGASLRWHMEQDI
jgi:MSHA biogenesis protein MshI